jgi:hypothetical protein
MNPMRSRLWLFAAGFACGGVGLGAMVVYAIYFTRHPWQDWMVYYAACRAYLDGNLPLIFDGARFTAHLNRYFTGWLHEPIGFRSWLYPPSFLLLLLPFGVLGFAASCALFEAVTFAGLLAAVGRYVGPGRRLLHALALLLAPAVWFNLVVGQNGFLTGGLLIGGFAALPRRPALAGTLLGLLSYKPQFWLLVPVALAAAGEWRVLASAFVTAAALALVSLGVFGGAVWLSWIHWAVNPPPADYQAFLACCRLHDESVYTNLTLLGATNIVADLGQVAAIVLAVGCTWWCWRRALPRALQLAVLLAATFLAAPHVANYDAVLLVVAASLVFAHGLDHGFRLGGAIVPLAVWAIQLLNPPDAFPIGRVTPFLTLLLIAAALRAANADRPAAVDQPFAGRARHAL